MTAQIIAPAKSNERISWDFFINEGFTEEQTAGILGNLKQENKFSTDGDGIAQWTGSRLEGLKQRGNHLDLKVQLDYIIHELKTTEKATLSVLGNAKTVEQATLAFQYLYERCGDCQQETRLKYANDIYLKYK